MENLAVTIARHVDRRFWAGKRVFVTGQTGFKGSWTSLWLSALGAHVSGFALAPDGSPSLFELANVARSIDSRIGDLRRHEDVAAAVNDAAPQIVLHMAAQPLVRRSFVEPRETFGTNVMGTVNLLEALRACKTVEAILVVTTDKVYANDESGTAFSETDRLGGHDPYAASKAACELVAASYAASFFEDRGIPLATARGGNVIGGGDFSADRIVPDTWRALRSGSPVPLRHPDATRPWQHVLDCVSGYFLYLESLASDPATPRALNFGPDPQTPISVSAMVEAFQGALDAKDGWTRQVGDHPREMKTLAINPAKARRTLGWRDRLPGQAAIQATAAWYAAFARDADMHEHTLQAIEDYQRL